MASTLRKYDVSLAAERAREISSKFSNLAEELTGFAEWLEATAVKLDKYEKWTKEQVSDSTQADNRPIDDLLLTNRTLRCLKSFGISTIGELTALRPTEILQVPNLGKRSLLEIKDAFVSFGLNFKQ